jgi:hypothetical protein
MAARLGDSVINYLYSDKNIYKRLLSFENGIIARYIHCNRLILIDLPFAIKN